LLSLSRNISLLGLGFGNFPFQENTILQAAKIMRRFFYEAPADNFVENFLLFPFLGPLTFRFWKFFPFNSRKYENENLEKKFFTFKIISLKIFYFFHF